MRIAEKLQKLMDSKGITKYRLAKETGVSYTGITKILSEQTKNPQIDSLKLIADYFGKPLDYFTEENENGKESYEQKEYYELTEKDERDIAIKLEAMMNDLETDASLSFMGEPMDEEDRDLLRISLENTLRMSREMAKKKFTPKKYRK